MRCAMRAMRRCHSGYATRFAIDAAFRCYGGVTLVDAAAYFHCHARHADCCLPRCRHVTRAIRLFDTSLMPRHDILIFDAAITPPMPRYCAAMTPPSAARAYAMSLRARDALRLRRYCCYALCLLMALFTDAMAHACH